MSTTPQSGQPSAPLHFSSQDVRDLLDGIDFSEDIPLPVSPPPAAVEEEDEPKYDGIRERMQYFINTSYRQYSVDSAREIPDCLAAVELSIVTSLSNFFERWHGHPRDEFEMEMYVEEYAEAEMYNPLEADYWEVVHTEINYLLAWEQMYGVTSRKRSSELHWPVAQYLKLARQ